MPRSPLTGAAYGCIPNCRSRLRRSKSRSRPLARFLESLNSGRIFRVPGAAIFLTRLSENMLPIIVNYVQRTGSLQKTAVLLSVTFERVHGPNARKSLRHYA
jgi:K+ transporter